MNIRYLNMFFTFMLSLFLYESNIFAQCYIWQGQRWSGSSVTYHINSDLKTAYATQQDYENAINSAVSQWNNAGSDFQFAQGSDVNYGPGNEPDGTYQIGYYVQGNDQRTAYTNVSYNTQTLLITQVETYFNQAYAFSANPNSIQLDIWSEAVHELGHWLDLQDETDASCSQNVMYEYLSYGDISHRYLTSDDKSGIVYVYGGTVGLEDGILVYSGPTSVTQNSQLLYDYEFVDNPPYGDYLTGSSGSLLIEHAEGEYVAATSPAYPGAPGYEAIFNFGTLPYGYCWLRDANGHVRGKVKITGTDEDGDIHTTYYNITVNGVPPNTTSGTLAHNETWGGQNILTGSVIVPAGITLKILLGATVKFPSNASLTVNGTLIANGIYVNRISFTSTGSTSPGAWGSIILNGSGAKGSNINYANIQYGTEVDVENTSNVIVQNCNVTNNLDNGIYFYNSTGCSALGNTISNSNVYHGIYALASTVNCSHNVIYKTNQNHQGAGILYSGSSGTVGENDIDYYDWGIAAIWGASPNADPQPPQSWNNRITHCLLGLNVYEQSYCDFGNPPGTAYCGNSIYSNSQYNAAVGYSYPMVASGLYACADYWANSSSFYVSSACYGMFSMPLSTDPWSGKPLPSIQSAPNDGFKQGEVVASVYQNNGQSATVNSVGSTLAGQSNSMDSLLTGIGMLEQGNQGGARDFFMSYLNRHPDNQAAYVELYACADSETTPSIIQYFSSLPVQAAKEHKFLLSSLYLRQNDIKSAKGLNDNIIQANPNTSLAIRANLNNFYIALYKENDPNGASTILKQVETQANLSTPMELSTAECALKSYVDPTTGQMPNFNMEQSTNGSVASAPAQNGLLGNYPNPFNPSTNISYNLSTSGHVTLKVYDILGREVRGLVDEDELVGYHNVLFDASRLASGVYFYRLTAPGIMVTKKMVVTK
ncbi:MAG: T9SS type A sorting domain-containing protein [Candidatus Kryptoniota bacterium]